MRALIQPFIIVAANLATEDADVTAITRVARKHLKLVDPPLKTLEGVYEGETERSYMIQLPGNGERFRKELRTIGGILSQDSILFVSPEGTGFLHYSSKVGQFDEPLIEYVGEWRRISVSEAEHLANYTFDSNSGQYYTCSHAAVDQPWKSTVAEVYDALDSNLAEAK